MSILQGVRSSYSLFGLRGVALVARARLQRKAVEVSTLVPGIKFPVYVRLRTSDVSLLTEMLQPEEHDLRFGVSPQVIVDAGANSGLTSVFYASRFPGARVFAIEPELSNFEMLEKNAAPYPNITCVRAALWSKDEKVNIADPGHGHWGFQIAEQPRVSAPTDSGTVDGITVAQLMKRFGIGYIDFLRVDIEGAEREVFQDASQWIDQIGMIAIELHDQFKSGCSRSVYLATRDFEWESRRGETVYLGREGNVQGEAILPDQSLRGSLRNRRSCTILSAR